MTTLSFTPLTDIDADVLRYVRKNKGCLPPFDPDIAHAIRNLKIGGCLEARGQGHRITIHGETMLKQYERNTK